MSLMIANVIFLFARLVLPLVQMYKKKRVTLTTLWFSDKLWKTVRCRDSIFLF